MQKKLITLYLFNELIDSSKVVALKDHIGINSDHYEWYKDFYKESATMGMVINSHDIAGNVINVTWIRSAEDIASYILDCHNEGQLTRGLAERFYDSLRGDSPDYTAEEFGNDLRGFVFDRLRDEYNALRSFEYVSGTIIANEYLFLRDGTTWNYGNEIV